MIFKKQTTPLYEPLLGPGSTVSETASTSGLGAPAETKSSASDGEVLRDIIFHFDAMEPNDDLPGS